MIKLSIVKNNVDCEEVQVQENLEAFAKTILFNDWSCGTFKDNYRNKENFQAAELIALDFDEGLSLEEAKLRFKDYWHVIATTRNHQKEKNGKACDRFRVMLKLESTCESLEDFEETYLELLKSNSEADSATKDASRFFYKSPTVVSSNFGGKTLPIVRASLKPKIVSLVPNVEAKEDLNTKARAMFFLSKIGPSIEGEHGDQHLFKAVQTLTNGFALTKETALKLLLEWNQGNIPPWDESSIRKKVMESDRYAKKDQRNIMNEGKDVQVNLEPNISSEERKKATDSARSFRDTYKIQLLPHLDVYLFPGNFSIVGAPTKGGKTVLTCSIAAHALSLGKKVLYISNEPPLEDVEDYITISYKEFDQAWDSGNFKFMEKSASLDTYSMIVTLSILKSSVNKYDLIVFDQLSYLTSNEKYREYEDFVHKALAVVRGTKTHILFTQQLKRSASVEMMNTPPHAWNSQNWLADCTSTVKPAQNGILYRADKHSGVGTLVVDAPRYRQSYTTTDELSSQWRQTIDGLQRVDKLATVVLGEKK